MFLNNYSSTPKVRLSVALLTRSFFAGMMVLISFSTAFSQKTPPLKNNIIRCGTMQYYKEQMQADPLLAQKARAIAAKKLKALSQSPANANRPQGTQAVIVIPVVFHVVGTAAIQTFSSDAVLQRQLDVLNRDYAGMNPDSSKIPAAFKSLFAHTNIRFALAKRTPAGIATNGIERRVSNRTFTSASSSYNTILKHTDAGGLDQWDGDKYYNVWVANFTDGLLGVATFPNVNPPLENEQGVAIHYGAVDETCGSPFQGEFDGGRSLVHETGHFFYLFHIWGDDNGDCTGSDFDTPFGDLPAACTDDTPNQSDATSGCLSGVQTDDCSTAAPGFMYQNYMDYTDDACYGMFTLAQACRAEAALELYRTGLTTSDGLVPVPGSEVNNDVRVSEILNPVSRGFACGTRTSVCNGPLNPQVLIVNDGDAPLTSLTFDIQVDGVSAGTQSWTGNLQPGDFTYVNISNVPSADGAHILKIKTLNPNGQPDGRPGTDSAMAAYSLLAEGLTVPVAAESFEGNFPPLGWRIDNQNTGSLTWDQSSDAGNPGDASAVLAGFDYEDAGHVDYLVSPKLQTAGYDSLVINFNVAYAKYSNAPAAWETLEVVYSEDCGITWKPTGYSKTGNVLATNGGAPVTSSFEPTAGQWRAETVKIGLCGIGPNITIGFKSTNAYGNNIYLDNISFDKLELADPNIEVQAVTDPNGLYCDGTIQPKVTIFNKGTSTLTAFTLNYNVDGGTNATYNWTGSLAKCSAPIVVTLPAITAAMGSHTFTVYSSGPNGTADLITSNDTVKTSFAVISVVNGNVTETFETAAFPPVNWAVQNFDNSTSWVRTTEAARSGMGSMVINNYDYATSNTLDRFVSPRIVLGTVDSAFVSFDYSYNQGAQYPGSTTLPLDTLELIVTKDCGLTSTTIWKKWGEDLQTQNDPNYPSTIAYKPTSVNQWRTERVNIYNAIAGATDFQVYFLAKSNKQNNLYIDNINIFGKVLPARLKTQGYVIYPSPFNTSFVIHHLVPPTDLRSAQVYNSAGQLVWEKRLNGAANTEVTVDLKNLASGVYILKMIYTDRTVVERIVKN